LFRPPSAPKDFEPVLRSIDADKHRLLRPGTSEAPRTPPRVPLLEKRLLKARDVLSASYNDRSKRRVVPLRRLDFKHREVEKSTTDLKLSTLLKLSLKENQSASTLKPISLKGSRNNLPTMSQLSKT
jgi:hypothetical protein